MSLHCMLKMAGVTSRGHWCATSHDTRSNPAGRHRCAMSGEETPQASLCSVQVSKVIGSSDELLCALVSKQRKRDCFRARLAHPDSCPDCPCSCSSTAGRPTPPAALAPSMSSAERVLQVNASKCSVTAASLQPSFIRCSRILQATRPMIVCRTELRMCRQGSSL